MLLLTSYHHENQHTLFFAQEQLLNSANCSIVSYSNSQHLIRYGKPAAIYSASSEEMEHGNRSTK